MSEAAPGSEFTVGMEASAVVAVPLVALSLPPAMFQSTAEHIHPVRAFDLPGMPDFFDHSGNFIDGVLLAGAVIGFGSRLDRHISDDHRRQLIIGTAAAGSVVSSGINVFFEANDVITSTKEPVNWEEAYDQTDAIYGSAAGTILSVVFCAAALWQRRKLRRRES